MKNNNIVLFIFQAVPLQKMSKLLKFFGKKT